MLYNKSYRRLTVEKITKGVASGKPFVFDGGCNPPFVQTLVTRKRDFSVYDQTRTDQYLRCWFAPSISEALRHFSREEDVPCLEALQAMMGDFTIVGRYRNGDLYDLH